MTRPTNGATTINLADGEAAIVLRKGGNQYYMPAGEDNDPVEDHVFDAVMCAVLLSDAPVAAVCRLMLINEIEQIKE